MLNLINCIITSICHLPNELVLKGQGQEFKPVSQYHHKLEPTLAVIFFRLKNYTILSDSYGLVFNL